MGEQSIRPPSSAAFANKRKRRKGDAGKPDVSGLEWRFFAMYLDDAVFLLFFSTPRWVCFDERIDGIF